MTKAPLILFIYIKLYVINYDMKFKFNSASMLDPQHPYSVNEKTPKYVE
jgi:hypothetical protein